MGCSQCKGEKEPEEKIDFEEQATVIAHESIKNELQILSQVDVSEQNTSENDLKQVLLQGEVVKVQPNTKNKQVSRWAQISRIDFRYYKNEYSAGFWWDRPLDKILVQSIDKVIQNPQNLCEFEILSIKNNFHTTLNRKTKSIKRPEKQTKRLDFEKKLIFATKTKEETGKWVNVLNGLINHN